MLNRPSRVMYTCHDFRSSSTCSADNPVYANMPIWEVIWDQSPPSGEGAPILRNAACNCSLILMTRLDMTIKSLCHCLKSSGSPSTVAAIRAPWRGGDEYIGLTIRCFTWLMTD